MLLLHPPRLRRAGIDDGRRPLVALFGVGLIGSALTEALAGRRFRPQPVPLAWDDPGRQERQLEAIGRRIDDRLGRLEGGDLSFVWAAGRAGFGSGGDETAPELESFRRVLALAESIARRRPSGTVEFHLVGSVGGLFEGQRYVDRDSRPAVRRPYGELKLRQEDLLAAAGDLRRRIYRLTSVFGPAPGGGRRGLITTLVDNGLRHRVTRIVGRLSTLRDFVWTVDVARYLAAELLDRAVEPGISTRTLAAGKPSSIHELVKLVESILGRRLYLQFDFGLANSMDITVSPTLQPEHWHPSDLRMAVRRLYLAAAAPRRP